MPTKGCGLITVAAAAANFTATAKEIKEGDNVLLKTPAPASQPAHIGLARRLLGSLVNRITLPKLQQSCYPILLPARLVAQASSCHNSSRCFEEHTHNECPVPNWPFKSPKQSWHDCLLRQRRRRRRTSLVVFIARCHRTRRRMPHA